MKQEQWLRQIEEVIQAGPYQDNWNSLTSHPVPAWFRSGKLGIFIHYGIYSVPAYHGEWYSRNMYDKNLPEYRYHREHFGPQDQFGYKDFIPMFRAEKFDASQWAQLFKQAGARYVVPVAEHHDGFAMYDTEWNRWNAAEMGPCRNVLGEEKTAYEQAGLIFCASTHRAEHYFFMNNGRTIDSDVNDERYADFYGPAVARQDLLGEGQHIASEDPRSEGPDEAYLTDWMIRTLELVDRYQPQALYFDWWIHNHAFKPYLKKIAAYYYNRAAEWGREVTIFYKHEAFAPGSAIFDVERGALSGISPVPWQTDTAIGKKSWGFTNDNEFKTAEKVICDLVDIVSKNGNLLLNVGPRPDGTITEKETEVLTRLGDWLRVNGEGIYDTECWKQFGEGSANVTGGYFQDNAETPYTASDFRFTYKGGCIYAFQMAPDGGEVKIRSLAKQKKRDLLIRSVRLLGDDAPLPFTRTEEALVIPADPRFCSQTPICFAIELL